MKDNKYNGPRVNERIRLSPVHVIGADGSNLGIIPTAQALRLAQDKGLDLVEVAPASRPPVCRIMDFGKYKYEQSIKEKQARQKQRTTQLKEMRFRPSTGEHDVQTKVNAIQKFLEEGQKVQIKIRFEKRENAHKDLGFKLISDIIERLTVYGRPQSAPKLEGRDISCIIEPGE